MLREVVVTIHGKYRLDERKTFSHETYKASEQQTIAVSNKLHGV